MLEGKSIARNFAKAMCSKPELPLRGLFICNNCGHNLTGSASKSRNGQRHFYYHCNYCKEVRISAEFVAEKMNSILAEIKFSKQAKDLYNVIIKKLLKTHVEKSKRSPGRIELEIKKYENRLQKMQDSFADASISANVFNQPTKRYEQMLSSLKNELRKDHEQDGIYQRYLKTGIDLLVNLPKFYKMPISRSKSS